MLKHDDAKKRRSINLMEVFFVNELIKLKIKTLVRLSVLRII